MTGWRKFRKSKIDTLDFFGKRLPRVAVLNVQLT